MMKKVGLGLAMCVVSLLTGCSMTGGSVGHEILTDVQLNQANFTVVKSVTGEAQADYFFGVGPSKQDLFGQAKRDMINNAQLKGPQALINVTTDSKLTGVIFFWRQQTVTVSAEVVQFIK